MTAHTIRYRGAARLVLAVLALAVILPGTAVANHMGECSEQLRTCVGYSPDTTAEVAFPYAGSPSTLEIQQHQGDHEYPVMKADYFLPKGWQFEVESIRPGLKADMTPATACSDIYSTSSPKTVARAEVLGNGLGASYLTGTGRALMRYGFVPNKVTDPRKGHLSFLNWDAATQTATLCWYLFTNESPPAGASEFIVPVQLKKLPATDPNGWQISIDWEPLVLNPGLFGAKASQITTHFFFWGQTSGNWHQNSAGQTQPMFFHRMPANNGNYTITTVLTGCERGVTATGCTGGFTTTATKSHLIQVTPPPEPGVYDFGKFTAPPAGTTMKNVGTAAYYSLSWGNSTYPVTWNQPPAVSPGKSIVAYELQVKRAGDSTDTFYERIAKAGACGADGSAPTCVVNLQFPINAGSSVFTTDGHYQLRLVTVYADGVRTDGQCDNGGTGGQLCDPNMADPVIPHAGYAEKFLLMRSRLWPEAHVAGSGSWPPNIGGNYPPKYVLFVDWGSQEVEFITWFPYAVEQSRSFHDNGLQRIDNNTAILQFGDAQLGGRNRRFQALGRMTGGNINLHVEEYEPRNFPDSCRVTMDTTHICDGTPQRVRNEDISFSRVS